MSTSVTSKIDLDFEVVCHLLDGNFDQLRLQNITPDLLLDVGAKSMLSFAYEYYSSYRKAPGFKVLETEFTVEQSRPPEAEVDYIADKLRARTRRIEQRKLVDKLSRATEEEFMPIVNRESKRIHELTSTDDYMVKGEDFAGIIEYHKQRIAEGATLGSTFGFEEVDDHTGGARKGHLVMLAALPKRGKTWFLLKAFLERVIAGENPALFTLELSKEDIVGRLLCLLSGVSYNSYYKGTLMPYQWKEIDRAIEIYSGLGGGHIIESPLGNRFVADFNLEADRVGADSILVDQFSFIQWAGNHSRENEGYKEIIYDMKNSAIDYDLSWYVAAQFNRTADESEGFPTAQQIGLTRAVEEASDLILGLKSNEELKEEHQVMLGVVEARHCESGPSARWTIQRNFYDSTEFYLVR